MGNWIINNDDNLYLCDNVSLNKLKISREPKEKIIKLLKVPKDEVVEISNELAMNILHKNMSEVTEDTIDISEVNYGSYPLSYNSILITGKSEDIGKDNELGILTKNIDINPLISLYKKNIVQKKLFNKSRKHIVIDLESKNIIRNIWLLKDYEFKYTSFYDELTEDSVNFLEKLNAISLWQNESIYNFLNKSTDLIQVPYKIALSNDSKYYAGIDAVVQDLRASYRNIESKFKEIYPSFSFIVADELNELLNKCSELILNAAPPEKIIRKRIYFNKVSSNSIISNMIHEFEEDYSKIVIEIKQHREANIYAMRATLEDKICTEWLYSTSPQELYNEVLDHFYTIYHQNTIILGKLKETYGEIISSADVLPNANINFLRNMLQEKYMAHMLKIDELSSANIYIFRIQERQALYE